MTHPHLIDRTALQRQRQRMDPVKGMFLHETAREDLKDRLNMVNKSFTAPAVVTPVPTCWDDLLPGIKVVPDDDVLDLTPGLHDLVIHAMALHWANDPVGQLIQCARALRPDGLLLAMCLGGQTLHELRASMAMVETEVTGGLSPRILPMGDVRDMGALLQRAGLALPVADSLPLKVRYQTPIHLMHDLRGMGETNALTDRLRKPTRRSVMTRTSQLYSDTHGDADGIIATYDIITLTGWAPDASQPKALRPGSATVRLADALDTNETPLDD